jgi:hypothetical protein
MTKIPYTPWGKIARARANDPETWGTLDQALAFCLTHHGGFGIGLVLTSGLVGLDFDGAVDEGGRIAPHAEDALELMQSYAEISPSGRGLHIIARGSTPAGWGNRAGAIEIYDHARFFCMTGRRIGGEHVEERQTELGRLPDLPTIKAFLATIDKPRAERPKNARPATQPAGDAATPPAGGAATRPGALVGQVARAAADLDRLAHWRCVDYQPWIEVGLALHDLGPVGLALWQDWSAGCPEKYDRAVCAEKWDSFTRTRPARGNLIRVASLAFWASQDDPRPSHDPPCPDDDHDPICPDDPDDGEADDDAQLNFGEHDLRGLCGIRAEARLQMTAAGLFKFEARWWFCKRRDCPRCARRRARQWRDKILRQVEARTLTMRRVSADDYKAETRRLRKAGVAWCAVLSPDKTHALLLSTEPGAPVSVDQARGELLVFLPGLPEDMTDHRRVVRSSKAFFAQPTAQDKAPDGEKPGSTYASINADPLHNLTCPPALEAWQGWQTVYLTRLALREMLSSLGVEAGASFAGVKITLNEAQAVALAVFLVACRAPEVARCRREERAGSRWWGFRRAA